MSSSSTQQRAISKKRQKERSPFLYTDSYWHELIIKQGLVFWLEPWETLSQKWHSVSVILLSMVTMKMLTMTGDETNDLETTWMHSPSNGEISFFKLSRIIPYIFSRKAVSCCLNSNAGYLASTCLKSSSLRKPRPLRNEIPGLWGEALRP